MNPFLVPSLAAVAFGLLLHQALYFILGPMLWSGAFIVAAQLQKQTLSLRATFGWIVATGLALEFLAAIVHIPIPWSYLGTGLATLCVALLGSSDESVLIAQALALLSVGAVWVLGGSPVYFAPSSHKLGPREPRQVAVNEPTPQPTSQRKPNHLEAALEANNVSNARVTEKPVVGPVVTRNIVKLPMGTKLNVDLVGLARDLGVKAVSVDRNVGAGCIAVDVPNAKREYMTLDQLLTKTNWPRGAKGKLPICFAVGPAGKPIVDDLASWVQAIVAGTTGAGKSVAMNAIILSLMASKAQFSLMIADGKGDDFAPYYAKSSYLLRNTSAPVIARTPNEMVEQLNALVGLMDQRAADHSLKRTPIIYLVDEVADLLMAGGKKQRQQLEDMLIRLAQKGRSFGILLLLATQSPSSKALPELLRANVPTRLGLYTGKAAQSAIIIDEPGCEQLLGKGDGLLKRVGAIDRVHCVNVTPADFTKYLR